MIGAIEFLMNWRAICAKQTGNNCQNCPLNPECDAVSLQPGIASMQEIRDLVRKVDAAKPGKGAL